MTKAKNSRERSVRRVKNNLKIKLPKQMRASAALKQQRPLVTKLQKVKEDMREMGHVRDLTDSVLYSDTLPDSDKSYYVKLWEEEGILPDAMLSKDKVKLDIDFEGRYMDTINKGISYLEEYNYIEHHKPTMYEVADEIFGVYGFKKKKAYKMSSNIGFFENEITHDLEATGFSVDTDMDGIVGLVDDRGVRH